MLRPRTNSRDLPAPDSRGRIRPHVGILPNGRKPRFQVGDVKTSRLEAERRLGLIRTLYEKQCSQQGISYWREWVRRVAVKIGMGQAVVDTCVGEEDNPRHFAGVVAQLREWGVQVIISNPEVYQAGLEVHRGQIAEVVAKMVADELGRQRRQRGAIADEVSIPADPMTMAETATLHNCLDAYALHLGDTGKKDADGNLSTRIRKQKDRLRYLKEHHTDIPVWRMDLPAIQGMVSYWRNRPETKKGNRCSREHARDMLKEFWGFLRWLDEHPRYKWAKPKGTDKIERSPHDLKGDESKEAFQTTHKQTYTPEQLATIATHTNDFGRALVGVCVNCAFGASEVGQWKTANYRLETIHPHQDEVGIESTPADSWIVGNRPKTGIYGEHLLWPEVANMVKPFLDREVLPITRTGNPWYRTHSNNPQTNFGNWWCDLIKRVQKEAPNFPYLPFGSLRDVLPDVLTARYSPEVASMALQHGKLSDDDLLKCYANTPFGKLFVATRELEGYFRPFLDALITRPAR